MKGLDRQYKVEIESAESLQEESRVSLGCVDSLEQFSSDILHGRWDQVLHTVSYITYPEETLHTLYEQVVCELVELGESSAARKLMVEASPLQSLKLIRPDRYRKLEDIIGRQRIDVKEIYDNIPRERKRHLVAECLLREIKSAPPSRLLSFIGMALKWQHSQGLITADIKQDVFRGLMSNEKDQIEECVQSIAKTIKHGISFHVQCATFSPDGQYLVTGSADGLIEVLDALSGALRSDLEFQAMEKMMLHQVAVMALDISRDSEILATGAENGQLKIWKLKAGKCIKQIDKAHNDAITSLNFNKDGSNILTASLDHTSRIYGLRSGRHLGTFRGHEAYVNCAKYSADGAKVITAASDGKVKVWDSKSFECCQTIVPPISLVYLNECSSCVPINQVLLSNDPTGDLMFVCTKSNTIYLFDLTGHIIKSFSSGKREGGDFVAAAVSPSSKWIYCAGEDKTIYCFGNSSAKLEHVMLQVHKADIFGLAHHPHHNILVSWAFDGALNFYRHAPL